MELQELQAEENRRCISQSAPSTGQAKVEGFRQKELSPNCDNGKTLACLLRHSISNAPQRFTRNFCSF